MYSEIRIDMPHTLSPENTLPKKERLYEKKRIDELFAQGKSFISYPLRVVYLEKENPEEDDVPVKVMVSVSKKYFKRAVKRNRVKRLIREAYRLNKAGFASIADEKKCSFDIVFLFLKKELPDYAEIEKAMLKTIAALQEKTKTVSE